MSEEFLNSVIVFAVPFIILVIASIILVVKENRKKEADVKQKIIVSAVNAMRELENENILWVLEFNRKLCLDLGGVLGVIETFVDPAGMLRFTVGLYDQMCKCRDAGVDVNSMSSLVTDMLSEKFPANYCFAVGRYIRLFGESFERLRSDVVFRKWVRSAEFSCQPDMETQALLQVVLGRIEKESLNV